MDKQNNKASNLRLATKTEQCINRNVFKNNKLGEKNIRIHKDTRPDRNGYEYYQINIKRNKKLVFWKQLRIDKFSLEDAKKIRDDFLNLHYKWL